MVEPGIGLKNPLFFIGVIENNVDPRLEGRVQVRAFSVHGTHDQVSTEDLPWAICASGDYGLTFNPPSLNSFVWGMFVDGRDAQQPIVLGLLPSQSAGFIDPAKYGWGVIPQKDGEIQAKGSAPRDFGQPQNSRLTRGEDIHETYVLGQEMNRIEDMPVAGTEQTWSEPSSAYSSKYPYNKTIETAYHSIEIDDTPGGERIMITHKEGSFIQIDAKGSMTEKSAADKFDITTNKKHEFAGNGSVITIKGDAHVYVEGNKTEHITGDYKLLVGGMIQVDGTQINHNASMQLQQRGGDVKIEANAGTLGLRADKQIAMYAGYDVTTTARKIFFTAFETFDAYSTTSMRLTSLFDTHVVGSNMYISMSGVLPPVTPLPPLPFTGVPSPTLTSPGFNLASGTFTNITTGGALSLITGGATSIQTGGATFIKSLGVTDISSIGPLQIDCTAPISIGSSTYLSLTAPFVAADDLIALGSGLAFPPIPVPVPPVPAGIGVPSIPSWPGPEPAQMPEPITQSTRIANYNPGGSLNSAGYVSPDPESER